MNPEQPKSRTPRTDAVDRNIEALVEHAEKLEVLLWEEGIKHFRNIETERELKSQKTQKIQELERELAEKDVALQKVLAQAAELSAINFNLQVTVDSKNRELIAAQDVNHSCHLEIDIQKNRAISAEKKLVEKEWALIDANQLVVDNDLKRINQLAEKERELSALKCSGIDQSHLTASLQMLNRAEQAERALAEALVEKEILGIAATKNVLREQHLEQKLTVLKSLCEELVRLCKLAKEQDRERYKLRYGLECTITVFDNALTAAKEQGIE